MDPVQAVLAAKRPEDVFGPIPADATDFDSRLRWLRGLFRRLARILHPDRNPDPNAGKAQGMLTEFKKEAESLLRAEEYGVPGRAVRPAVRPTSATIVRSKKHAYVVAGVISRGDISDVYEAEQDGKADKPVVLKIARDSRDRDLLEVEAKALKRLHERIVEKPDERGPMSGYLPRFVESFSIAEVAGRARPVNVLSRETGFYTLADVKRAYPDGVEPKAMAWMWSRVLEILMFAHRHGVVHCAVHPSHVLINPETHGGMLIDWSYAVIDGGSLVKAVPADWKEMYPAEVVGEKSLRGVPTPATDIYLAAKVAVYILGGDVRTGVLPDRVPKPIRDILRACLIPGQSRRFQDVKQVLFGEFKPALETLYGKPKFCKFAMPRP